MKKNVVFSVIVIHCAALLHCTKEEAPMAPIKQEEEQSIMKIEWVSVVGESFARG